MTLSFIASAVRRHLRLVIAGVLLGLLGGLAVPFVRAGVYKAETVLLLDLPPGESSGGADVEKYLASQLTLLGSTSLINSVAEVVGESPVVIREAVAVTPEPPNTVRIAVLAVDAGSAKRIADAYADEYLKDHRRRVNASLQRELDFLTGQRQALNPELVRLAEAVRVAPADVLTVNALTAAQGRAADIDRKIEDLGFQIDQPTGTEITKPAETPKTAEGLTPVEWALAGLFGGVFLGVGVAAMWAANSGRLLDAAQLEELLGVPVAARLPVVSALSKEPSAGLEILPAAIATRIDRLCVRAEGVGPANGRQLRVCVVGTAPECGVTTLALLLGARMAQSRMTVGLMDADALNPWISRRLSRNVGSEAGPRVAERKRGTGRRQRGTQAERTAAVAAAVETTEVAVPDMDLSSVDLTAMATAVERLVVLGAGLRAEQAFQHASLEAVWQSLDEVDLDVVVFDAGSMMDAALSVRLAQQVDVVVLLVPLAHQSVDQLRVVKRLFDGRRVEILPVVTDVVARRQLD